METQSLFEELLIESRKIEDIASKIQADDQTGVSKDQIELFTEHYHEWYTDCIVLLPTDLQTKFRSEYEGSLFVSKIKRFLESPMQKSVLYQPEKPSAFSYWQMPYETCFRGPFLAQKQIIREASKRSSLENNYYDNLSKIELIIRRFHLVARQLLHRYNKRTSIEIKDEYDVQDLFHALLRIYFDDIRAEETTPSYAGGGARIDFLLKAEKIVIEIKKTRSSMKLIDLRNQLIVDIDIYRNHPDCKTLVALVYDPDLLIENPLALENDLSRQHGEFKAKVFVVQK